METRATQRRYGCFNPRFLIQAVGAAAVIIVAAIIGRGYPKGSTMRIAMAVVEGIATGAVIVMPWWYRNTLDEMQQRIQLEALAIAFFGTGVLGAGYGFLEHAGLPPIEWGVVIWPAMVGLWAIGHLIAWRRYR